MNLVHTVYFSYLQKLRLSHACAFFTCMLFLYQSILPILSNSSWGLRRRLWDLPSLEHEISQGLVSTSCLYIWWRFLVPRNTISNLSVLWCYLYSLLSAKRKRLSAPVPVMGSQASHRHRSTHAARTLLPPRCHQPPTEHPFPPEPSHECQGGIHSTGECILCSAKR